MGGAPEAGQVGGGAGGGEEVGRGGEGGPGRLQHTTDGRTAGARVYYEFEFTK